ncbi:hypothetical protein E1B28_006167 [Marasmius oreades]|uniref:DNA-directed RNA polymerase III subunit n=1 Tax=Marasmius oreades TaxID=181124 RepID=A0A9P7UVB7_9AGAR|nr:uncharacterized protein E1B28_006167 [Marasmius oreades]KAG7095418.1 hypothetical protein E1B28_006167 [Marasmius oreades]
MAGRGRGGGRARGRGGFGGSREPPPMGLAFADIQAMSREQTALYPPMRPPVLTEYSDRERKITQFQIDFAHRLRASPYYVVETTKSTELPRYSDKYRPSVAARPKLRRQDLHPPFFPTEILEDYFNPKRIKTRKLAVKKNRVNLDNMADDENEQTKSEDEVSDGTQAPASDYDAEEEYDNDYAYNYFDNGEGDDMDNLGDGGGGDEGGGDYD